ACFASKITWHEIIGFSIPKRVNFKLIIIGLLLSFLSIIAYVIISEIMVNWGESRVEHPLQNFFLKGEFNTCEVVLIGLVVIFLTPFSEELLFRRFIFEAFNSLDKKIISIIITSLIFAWLHFNYQAFITYFIIGFILQVVYLRSKNLFYCVAIHSIYNAVQFFIMIYQGD
ncbi:MAG: lysostaphin resistance A-like protein, partial [Lentisphaeria bacterium]